MHACLQVASSRKGHGAGHTAVPGVRAAAAGERNIEIMRVKRGAHAAAIAAHHAELSDRAGTCAAALDTAARGSGGGGAAAQAATAADGDERDDCEAERLEAAAAQRRNAWSGAAPMGAELASGRFRDDAFYISEERKDRHEEAGFAMVERGHNAIAAEVLDMNAEDSAGLAAQKRKRTVWDPKKKRYVTLQGNEELRFGKRVATGDAQVGTGGKKGGKGGKEEGTGRLYKQWVKQVGSKAAETLGKGVKGGQAPLASRCAFTFSECHALFMSCIANIVRHIWFGSD